MDRRNSVRHAWLPIGALKPYGNQLREHDEHQRRKISKLLDQLGTQPVPIIVTPELVIVDGHALWETLRQAGAAEVFVAVLENQSAAEMKAIRLAINRIPQDSRWNKPRLRNEIGALIELSFDLELTGFDTAEIDSILRLDIPQANVLEDEEGIPRPPADAITQPGDIFQLGPHRVGCGNAHDHMFVDRVRECRPVDICWSDPPYNKKISEVSSKGRTQHREFLEASGELSSEEFFVFLKKSLEIMKGAACPSALIYTCIDWRHVLELTAAGRVLGLPLVNIAVWVKSNGGMGNLYRSRHELICIFKAGAEPHNNNVELGRFGRSRTNVWEYPGMSSFGRDRDELLTSHPTVKPVALIADALRDTTKPGGLVLDPFLGSGSALIAAEEIGRTCFGVELDPRYVDVAVRRWQKATGRDAVHELTGKRFDDLTGSGHVTRRLAYDA